MTHCDEKGCLRPAIRRVEVDRRRGGAYFQYACVEHVVTLAQELESLQDGLGIAWIREGSTWEPVFEFETRDTPDDPDAADARLKAAADRATPRGQQP